MYREIINLLADCARSSGGDFLQSQDPDVYVRKLLDHADFVTWQQGGSLFAFVAFYANDPDCVLAYISMVATRPDKQGRGVARSLLTSCLLLLSAKGFKKCRLEVAADNERAKALYFSLGFVEVSREKQILLLELAIETSATAPGGEHVT
nr:GNAT family N-acetyltransferase [uncultured Pseudoxanthomonas sp.]